MSNIAVDAAFAGSRLLREHRFKRVLRRVEVRVGEDRGTQRLSLSSTGHLYEREGASDRQQASETTEERSLRVAPDQLVVNPMWLTGGSIAVSDVEGAVSPDYRVFELDSESVDARYLHHLLRSQPYRDQYNLFVRANTTFDRRIQQEDLDQLPLWLPTREEQRRIADFLDDRVARIDQVITARRRQTVLLEAATSTAIADLLSPGWQLGRDQDAASLRRSRTTEIQGRRLSYVLRFSSGSAITSDDIEAVGEYPVYGANGLRGYAEAFTHTGTYVLVGRQGALCGNVTRASGRFWASEHALVGQPLEDFDVNWMLEVLRSLNLRQYSQSAAQPGISAGQLGSLRIPWPDRADQERLGTLAQGIRNSFHKASVRLKGSIDLLLEYKQSLITAVVTGELDVTTAGSGIPG